MAKKIVVIPGDGIGAEITESAVAVLKKVDEKYCLGLEYEYHDAGGRPTTNLARLSRMQPLRPARRQTGCCSAPWGETNGMT